MSRNAGPCVTDEGARRHSGVSRTMRAPPLRSRCAARSVAHPMARAATSSVFTSVRTSPARWAARSSWSRAWPVGSVVPTRPDSAVASSSGRRRQLGAPCPGFHMHTLTLVGRSGLDGDVDRVGLKSGRWAQKPGEIVLGASIWPLRPRSAPPSRRRTARPWGGAVLQGERSFQADPLPAPVHRGIGISNPRLCRVLVSRVCVVVAVGDSVCSVRLVRELFKPAGPSSVSSLAEGCL